MAKHQIDPNNPRATWLTLLDDDDRLDVMAIGPRAFLFVEVMDMVAACGRDADGHDPFCGEVDLVDLDVIPLSSIRSAMESCGWDGSDWSGMPNGYTWESWRKLTYEQRIAIRDSLPLPDSALAIAEACFRSGCKAPLDSTSGGGRIVVLREMRRSARALARDPDILSDAMDRPVNGMGSTAREYMTGDFTSALQRGCEAGDPNARLMAKMYQVPDDVVNDARPADWLPYVAGYSAGHSGAPAETDPDLAAEYTRGYQRGSRVRAGECPPPSWITR